MNHIRAAVYLYMKDETVRIGLHVFGIIYVHFFSAMRFQNASIPRNLASLGGRLAGLPGGSRGWAPGPPGHRATGPPGHPANHIGWWRVVIPCFLCLQLVRDQAFYQLAAFKLFMFCAPFPACLLCSVRYLYMFRFQCVRRFAVPL